MPRALALLVPLCLAASPVGAQAPREITLVAPAAPGGGWDQLARTMQRVLEAEGLATGVQVENVPGAAGTIGLARFVSGRRGDPAALLVTGLVMVGGIAQNASPVSLADATPIARLVGEYEAIAVPSTSPFKSLGDVLAAFAADPGAVSWGGGSAGGADQMLVDLVARARGIDPRRTSYVAFAGGGEARTALLGSQVSVGVSGVGEFAELSATGEVRILAVSSPTRLAGIDAPTLREAGVDVVLANWRGVLAPPGLRGVQRRALESLMEEMVRSQGWKAALAQRGWEDLWMGSEAFERYAAVETRRVESLAAERRGRGGPVVVKTWWSRWPVTAALVMVLALLGSWWRRERAGGDVVGQWRPVALMVAALIANILLVEGAGFVVGAALVFVMAAAALGERRWSRLMVTAVLFAVVVLAVFRGALDVALPLGRWWGMDG